MVKKDLNLFINDQWQTIANIKSLQPKPVNCWIGNLINNSFAPYCFSFNYPIGFAVN